MKKLFFSIITIIFFLTFIIIGILSTTGYETARFNKLITEKIKENNKKFSLELNKIKFKFDLRNMSLFLETSKPNINYQNLKIPVESIKVYLDLVSVITSKTKIDLINVNTSEIAINELKEIVLKTKPSNLNSFISNKVENGKLKANIEFYLDDKQQIQNYIIRGEAKDMHANLTNKIDLKKTNFSFFADASDILIKNIKSETDGLLIENGNVQLAKEGNIELKSDFQTKIKINENNVDKYLDFVKNSEIDKNTIFLDGKLNHFINITFDKTYKVINYDYKNKGKIEDLSLKLNQKIKSSFLRNEIHKLYLKDTEFNTHYSKKDKNEIIAKGKYSLNDSNYQNFNLENKFLKENFELDVNLDIYEAIRFEILNYEKEIDKIGSLVLQIQKKKDMFLIKNFKLTENKSSVLIKDLKIKKNSIISLSKVKVKTYNKNSIKNDFTLDFGKNIKISGNNYDAENLSKFFNQKTKNNLLKKINKEIDIDLKNIGTPLSKKLSNFKLIGLVEKGKFIKISAKGDFGNNQFLDISMKSDEKSKKKYLEIYSDLPQPLLSDYNFFKGLTGGNLTFSSIIGNQNSSSKLIVKDFKIVNAPGVVKLLSLADFGGLADLAEGEGLSFETLEINMNNQKGFLKLDEIYAVGPSISVLMEGYKEESGLISLRGTLVPAKNLNKILSKIPVIGNIIIPQEVGEGLFGVSFKMKGMPGKIKTTINPIKTLTPRFITRALEKSKKTK